MDDFTKLFIWRCLTAISAGFVWGIAAGCFTFFLMWWTSMMLSLLVANLRN